MSVGVALTSLCGHLQEGWTMLRNLVTVVAVLVLAGVGLAQTPPDVVTVGADEQPQVKLLSNGLYTVEGNGSYQCPPNTSTPGPGANTVTEVSYYVHYIRVRSLKNNGIFATQSISGSSASYGSWQTDSRPATGTTRVVGDVFKVEVYIKGTKVTTVRNTVNGAGNSTVETVIGTGNFTAANPP